MIDQLIIEEQSSFDDYGASVCQRKIGKPKKKSIKKTVPFSNKTYDFSKINGELYWEERELEYVFEMTADTPEELEEMKAAFSGWVMNVIEAKIYDPFIEDYHFIGTYEDMDFEDDEGMDKTTATVKFKAYPYMVANIETTYIFTVTTNKTISVSVVNNSAHRIVPTIFATGEVVFNIGNSSYTVPVGTTTDEILTFEAGTTDFEIQNNNSSCTVKISFFEEVF